MNAATDLQAAIHRAVELTMAPSTNGKLLSPNTQLMIFPTYLAACLQAFDPALASVVKRVGKYEPAPAVAPKAP